MKNKNYISLIQFIVFVCSIVLLIVFVNYREQQEEKTKKPIVPQSITKKSQSYHEDPFRINTSKEEFDSLGIKMEFLATIPDFKGAQVQEIFWIPRNFFIYTDGYFVWQGNRMDVFLSQKQKYPGAKFLLIGDHCGNFFVTCQMYVVW
ncbi:MAG: hypothetical protein NTY80_02490 [candidate division SR1 bacterium]|nr:hypothetical protein [candidate division SR1 bacterium]